MAPEVDKTILIDIEIMSDQNYLRYMSEKISKLSCLYRSMQLNITILQARQNNVLFALQDCRIFYFVNYRFTYPSDLLKSSLILSDEPLTVESLFELNLHNRALFLAYFSACETEEIKHNNLIDETLYLISAYQLADFRHVIDTLWKVNNQLYVETAAIIYE